MDYKTGKEEAVKAVMDINAQYPENKSYQARNPSRIAGGYLYQVTFRGSNDEQYTNFAFRRGNVTRAYYYIEDFVADTEAVDSTFRDPDFLRLVVASVTSSILCIAVIYAAFDGKSDAVGVLAGLFGTAFGYAVGSYSSGRKQSD